MVIDYILVSELLTIGVKNCDDDDRYYIIFYMDERC